MIIWTPSFFPQVRTVLTIESKIPESKQWLFELCATTTDAAGAAQRGGADRIELCANLSVGGVTPDQALLESVLREASIPVHVLIRPRAGDFVYTAEEFKRMMRQIEAAKAAGASGIAMGVLLPNGRVDVVRSRKLVEAARPMRVTFHRAFDETRDIGEALEDVLKSGADCLLTSGGAPDVLAGAASLAHLYREAGTRIQLMAGGGLRLENLAEFVQRTRIRCVHGSLTRQNGNHGGNATGVLLEDAVREAVRVLSNPSSEPAHAGR